MKQPALRGQLVDDEAAQPVARHPAASQAQVDFQGGLSGLPDSRNPFWANDVGDGDLDEERLGQRRVTPGRPGLAGDVRDDAPEAPLQRQFSEFELAGLRSPGVTAQSFVARQFELHEKPGNLQTAGLLQEPLDLMVQNRLSLERRLHVGRQLESVRQLIKIEQGPLTRRRIGAGLQVGIIPVRPPAKCIRYQRESLAQFGRVHGRQAGVVDIQPDGRHGRRSRHRRPTRATRVGA